MSTALRGVSEALRCVDDQWASVTTATQPSHEYVAAARDLFTILKDVGLLPLVPIESRRTEAALDLEQALLDLHIAGIDLAELLRDSQHLPDVLIRSEVLFAPVRALKPSLDRLSSRNRGGYVVVATAEVPNLAGSIQRAGAACRSPRTSFKPWWAPILCQTQAIETELEIHPPDSAPGFA